MSDFLPTPEGAEQVIRAARRRRTAKVSAGGSSALAVVVALLLTTGGTAAQREPDRLSTTSTPTPATSPSSPSAPGRGGPTPNSAHHEQAPPPSLFPSPSPGTASAPPSQHRTTAKRVSPITRIRRPMDRTDLCDGDANIAASGYCVRAYDRGVIHRGHTVAIGGEVCVPTTGRTTTIHADTTREVDIKVLDSGGVLWTGGEGIRYSRPGPTITIEPGNCVGWTSPWDTRDREGFVVPPGTYDLSIGIAVENSVSTWGGSLTVED